jgi:(2Fe-2S) ferredoxin
MPRKWVFVCINERPQEHPRPSCIRNGSAALFEAIREETGRLGLVDVKVVASGCLEPCMVGPTIYVAPDDVWYGGVTLDDVGDMAEVKQALNEAVLWPLRYPDSFARLGVTPPRGVLLYGPPGGGKTFLVRALAGTGALNVFSVKGAELMDKWVGESERAVRELFRRARDAAPSLVFLDEIDALAPRRGQSSDSGVADRVVASLLTELDGVEQLRGVVVLGGLLALAHGTNDAQKTMGVIALALIYRTLILECFDPRQQTEVLKAALNLLEGRLHSVTLLGHRTERYHRGRFTDILHHGRCSSTWIQHPEPTGSGRATPPLLPQHPPGHHLGGCCEIARGARQFKEPMAPGVAAPAFRTTPFVTKDEPSFAMIASARR